MGGEERGEVEGDPRFESGTTLVLFLEMQACGASHSPYGWLPLGEIRMIGRASAQILPLCSVAEGMVISA